MATARHARPRKPLLPGLVTAAGAAAGVAALVFAFAGSSPSPVRPSSPAASVSRKVPSRILPRVTRVLPVVPASASGTVYTVRPGDTLWGIARKLLGNGADWKQIAVANKIRGGAVSPGETLRVGSP